MDTAAAIIEFTNVMQVAVGALKSIISADEAQATDLGPEIDQLSYLVDQFEDLAARLRSKTSAALKKSAG